MIAKNLRASAAVGLVLSEELAVAAEAFAHGTGLVRRNLWKRSSSSRDLEPDAEPPAVAAIVALRALGEPRVAAALSACALRASYADTVRFAVDAPCTPGIWGVAAFAAALETVASERWFGLAASLPSTHAGLVANDVFFVAEVLPPYTGGRLSGSAAHDRLLALTDVWRRFRSARADFAWPLEYADDPLLRTLLCAQRFRGVRRAVVRRRAAAALDAGGETPTIFRWPNTERVPQGLIACEIERIARLRGSAIRADMRTAALDRATAAARQSVSENGERSDAAVESLLGWIVALRNEG